jgi:hypothetical protein
MKTRSASASGSITSIPLHLCEGATDSQINPTVKTVTIGGVTVKVGSSSHKRLMENN